MIRRAILAFLLLAPVAALPQSDTRPVIVLPSKLIADQPATLAVLDHAGRLLPNAIVEFSGGERVTTDSTGRAIFTAPAQQGVVFAELVEHERKVKYTTATSQVVSYPASAAEGVHITDLPRTISLQDRFSIAGSGFRGEADANRVTLGGQPAAVLAASPIAAVLVANPACVPGNAPLTIEVGGNTAGPMPVTLVALQVETAAGKILPNKKQKIQVRLRGTELPMEIRVRNLMPEIVDLHGGDTMRTTTSGGAANVATVEVKGRREGEFAISVRLVPTAAGLPDTATARRELLAAKETAPAGWAQLIERLVRHLDEHPEHALDVRNELEKLLAQAPGGEYGRHLEAAWKILLRP